MLADEVFLYSLCVSVDTNGKVRMARTPEEVRQGFKTVREYNRFATFLQAYQEIING